jgi:Tol biopolymer transport system component
MIRRFATSLLLAALALPASASAQYFGQNKVKYSHFDFKVLETEHFDVYYYDEEREAALDVARMAERSYARLSRVLKHEFKERKPIILYASHSDFQQTNTTPGEVNEGTGGFTDFLKHRNVIPLTGSYYDISHVLQHEMVHQFQYDVWSGGRAGGGLQTILAVNPPLWFVEGMAEYFSIGELDPNTAMWIRDATAEGKLPTIQQLEFDPRIFPYRFGQSIITYIGERWGDEAVGAILLGSRSGSLEGAMRRVIGLDFRQLGDQWREAMQQRYLPELASRAKAKDISQPLLTKELSEGTLHLAPALSPDGSRVAYFSEKDFYFVDLWLADGRTGKPLRRLLESTWSSNYETFRFINSAASWSPDGKYIAFAAKRGPKDDIVIVDVARNKQVRRIGVALSGVTTPSWSPDGQQLVFTGYDGGLSDLFTVKSDGTGLTRLTNDKYADLHPTWSPDGKTIAFTTDRGPGTDFTLLTVGNYRLATIDVMTSRIDLLPGMDVGKNTNPQWAPDGKSLAFVSDRNGVSNIFLFDLEDGRPYQLTDFYTGVQGITPLSPSLSWAPGADELAYVYYEDGEYDVYKLANPRALKREPWTAASPTITVAARDTTRRDSTVTPTGGSALYRGAQGLRRADSLAPVDPSRPRADISIIALMDSAQLGLPDTSTFTERKYKVGFSPDYVARPSIGYARDNFGNGLFGGTTVTLSDMLGDRQMVFSGYVNGRIDEAQVLAAYANLSRRASWAVGVQQDPYFFFQGSFLTDGPTEFEQTFVTRFRRLVLRSAFVQGAYPFSRFSRLETGLRATNVDDAILDINEVFDPFTGALTRDIFQERTGLGSVGFVQPSLALVHDNTVWGYIGPMMGRSSRFELAPTIGGWKYLQATADYRRYDRVVGPFTFASRLLYSGRSGRDADRFSLYLGFPDLLRGYTSGSFLRNECATGVDDPNSTTGCAALDQLVGTSFAVGNFELRFPLMSPNWSWVPRAVPPIEAAFFYDIGVAWNGASRVAWSREAGESQAGVRVPLRSVGLSLKTNIFGLVVARFDLAKPLQRPGTGAFWTVSFGPMF